MATLTGQSIASSYEQLLHVDADGGGNSTTHVSVKDGDNGTTFALTLATDAVMITSTNRLEFGDDGTYINQSGDGILNITSDTELELNATAIDINGAVDISGNTTTAGDIIIDADDKALVLGADQDASIFSDSAGTISFVRGQDYSPAAGDTEGWIKMGIGDSSETYFNIYGGEGGAGSLNLVADGGDDNADYWKITADTSGNYTVDSYSTGSYVTHLKLDANSRISLSNNDGNTYNTVFGKSAFTNGGTVLGDVGADYNVAIGEDAMGTGTTLAATYNTAVGYKALEDITAGDFNTCIGRIAGSSITEGDFNTVFGQSALMSETIGNDTTAIGDSSLAYQVLGSDASSGNTGLGTATGYYNVTGTNNTYVGYHAGVGVSTKSHSGCVFIGSNAGLTAYTGNNNIAIGYGAMDDVNADANVGASTENIFIGKDAGGGTWVTAASNYNTSIGNYAMDAELNGAVANTALGYGALTDLTTGDYNTSIGMETLYENVDGSNNVAVGYRAGEHDDAGSDATSPDQCVIIGAEADFDTVTPTNEIVIGYDANGKGDNTATIGNAACTAVYMADDSGATVHADKYLSSTMPAFMVHPSNPQTDIAEDSPVTVVFDVESGNGYYDQGGNFASNTFTAPVDGKYQLNCTLRIDQMDTGPNYYQVNLETSNHSFPNMWILDPGVLASDPNYWAMSFAALVDMDATDTAHITFYQDAAGTGGQTDLSNDCTFSGYLVC